LIAVWSACFFPFIPTNHQRTRSRFCSFAQCIILFAAAGRYGRQTPEPNPPPLLPLLTSLRAVINLTLLPGGGAVTPVAPLESALLVTNSTSAATCNDDLRRCRRYSHDHLPPVPPLPASGGGYPASTAVAVRGR